MTSRVDLALIGECVLTVWLIDGQAHRDITLSPSKRDPLELESFKKKKQVIKHNDLFPCKKKKLINIQNKALHPQTNSNQLVKARDCRSSQESNRNPARLIKARRNSWGKKILLFKSLNSHNFVIFWKKIP